VWVMRPAVGQCTLGFSGAGWQGETYHEVPKPKLDVLSWAPRIFHAENLLTPGVHVHEKHS